MHRLLRTSLPLVVLLGVLLLLMGACGGGGDDTPDVGEEATPYRIGVMDSVTGPGVSYGTVLVQAKQMARDEINESGGINGRPLELVVEDSKCGAQDAIVAYNKLTDVDGVKIILGTSCSGAMLGAAPLGRERWSGYAIGLCDKPRHRHCGRVHLSHRHK